MNWDECVQTIKRRDGLSQLEAYAQAYREYPDHFRRETRHLDAELAKRNAAPVPDRLSGDFQAIVNKIAADEKITKVAACTRARIRHPDLYKALSKG